MAKTNNQKSPVGGMRENRVENIMAFMAAGVVGASLLSMIIVLALTFAHVTGIPPLLGLIPTVGFPIGFVLVLVLLVTSLVRKARENRK